MDKSEVESSLNAISGLAEEMICTPEDSRIGTYRRIDRYLRRIEANLARCPNQAAMRMLDELKVHLIALARLDDPDELTDEQHCAGVRDSLAQLRGRSCFGIV